MTGGWLLAALFAFVFLGVGVLAFVWLLSGVWEWARVQGWQAVPATITRADLRQHRDSEGSVTYSVGATYEYEFNGRRHTGDRVSLYPGPDNLGSFHQDIVAELSRYQLEGRPFRCYVNPKNPAQSILYRNVRFGFLLSLGAFAAAFGGIGAGLLAVMVAGRHHQQITQALAARHPDQPWLHRPDWSRGESRNSSGATMVVAGALALVASAVALPLLYVVPQELRNGNWLAVLALILPAIAIGLDYWAVRSALVWRRFGASTLKIHTMPARPGERFAGVLYTSVALPSQANLVHLALKCIRTTRTRSGDKSTQTLWEGAERSTPSVAPEGCQVPVEFAIPGDLPSTSTDTESGDSRVFWELSAKADIPGVDFDVSFEVPVFARNAHE